MVASRGADYHILSIRHLLKKIISDTFIANISDFFSTRDLVTRIRPVSHQFNQAVKNYLPCRLQQEAEFINAFLEENEDINMRYLKIVDTQIPLARNNWLEFDFQPVTEQLSKMIGKQELTNLKFFLKRPISNSKIDVCLAPLCLLFGVREERVKEANGQVRQVWHRQAFKLV